MRRACVAFSTIVETPMLANCAISAMLAEKFTGIGLIGLRFGLRLMPAVWPGSDHSPESSSDEPLNSSSL